MNILDDSEYTGGPAYPAMEVRTHDTGDLVKNASQGMTLLDHYAGLAMQAIISKIDETEFREYFSEDMGMQALEVQVADFAWETAVLMVRQRKAWHRVAREMAAEEGIPE